MPSCPHGFLMIPYQTESMMSPEEIADCLHHEFQPIVSMHTGDTFGFEALLRGWPECGFQSIAAVFDYAFDRESLYELDIILRKNVVERYCNLGLDCKGKLFYNLDNRLFCNPRIEAPDTRQILDDAGIPSTSLVFEISEQQDIVTLGPWRQMLGQYRDAGYHIAMDDFGTGYSGLQTLFHAEPDILKIDRFLVTGVADDPRRRIVLSHIVNMAHVMGMSVIAEGVETDREFFLCREIGCDYAQGFLIARPTADPDLLTAHYPGIRALLDSDRRKRDSVADLLEQKIDTVRPVLITSPVLETLEVFRASADRTLFPVVNELAEPLGVIREARLKSYVYSPFGISLLQNRNFHQDNSTFLSKAPVADIHAPVEAVIEAYALDPDADAVIITENGKYRGLLHSRALIEVLNEKKIRDARDQNPLSHLPGNHRIHEYISHALSRNHSQLHLFVYIDFDNFKAFNDRYGFRLGDRAIVLFADALASFSRSRNCFAGHIGGDDFFLGATLRRRASRDFEEQLGVLLRGFAGEAQALYSPEDRERGYVMARGRDGRRKRFPLLQASAAALRIDADHTAEVTLDQISERIALMKHAVKLSSERLMIESWETPAGC